MKEIYIPPTMVRKLTKCLLYLPMQQNSYCMNLEHKYILKREKLNNYFLVVDLCGKSSSKISLIHKLLQRYDIIETPF